MSTPSNDMEQRGQDSGWDGERHQLFDPIAVI